MWNQPAKAKKDRQNPRNNTNCRTWELQSPEVTSKCARRFHPAGRSGARLEIGKESLQTSHTENLGRMRYWEQPGGCVVLVVPGAPYGSIWMHSSRSWLQPGERSAETGRPWKAAPWAPAGNRPNLWMHRAAQWCGARWSQTSPQWHSVQPLLQPLPELSDSSSIINLTGHHVGCLPEKQKETPPIFGLSEPGGSNAKGICFVLAWNEHLQNDYFFCTNISTDKCHHFSESTWRPVTWLSKRADSTTSPGSISSTKEARIPRCFQHCRAPGRDPKVVIPNIPPGRSSS